MPEPDRFLALLAITAMVGLGRSAIYERMAADQFPASRHLGGNCVRWLESEVVAWMRSRPTYVPRLAAPKRKATPAAHTPTRRDCHEARPRDDLHSPTASPQKRVS